MKAQISDRDMMAIAGACSVIYQIIPEVGIAEPFDWLLDQPQILSDQGSSVRFRICMCIRKQKTDVATIDVELWQDETWKLVSAVSEYNSQKIAWRFNWDNSIEKVS